MAYNAPSTRSTGELCTAAIWNADVVANEIAIYAGGLSITSQAVGDLLYASSTTQTGRVAAVAAGQVLTSAGTGTIPAYSATPALTSVDMGSTTVYGSRAITVDTGGVLNVVLASAAGDDFTVDTDKLVVSGDTGFVGIGTAAPDATLAVVGAEGASASFHMYADEGDDGADQWKMAAETNGTFTIANWAVGGSGNVLTIAATVATWYPDGTSGVVKSPNIYGTSALWGGAGSVNSVGIGFGTDTDTGFILAATNAIGVVTTGVERVRIDASGDVGIGTTAPDGTLHVHSATAGSITASSLADDLVVENSADGGMSILTPDANFSNIKFGSPSDATGAVLQWKLSTLLMTLGTTRASGQLSFYTGNSAEAMRIDATGHLLVGHTSAIPGFSGSNFAAIQATGTTDDAATMQVARFSNNNATAQFSFLKSRGGIGSYTIVQDGDRVGCINYLPADGSDFNTHAACFKVEVDDPSPAANDIGMAFVFEQMPGAGGGVLRETMRISAAGLVGINTAAPVSLLDVRGPTGTGTAPAGLLTLATNELTIVDGDQLGRIEFRSPIATAGTDAIVTAASIWAEANATFSASVNSADIVFATATSGSASERMRILSSGNVGISVTDPGVKLEVSGDCGSYAENNAQVQIIGSTDKNMQLRMGYRTDTTNGYGWLQAVRAGTDQVPFILQAEGNKVGIGAITAPDGTLHVHTATAGSVTAGGGADDLVVENSTHVGMTFLSPSGNYQQTIAFGDVGDADSGRIVYDHNSNLLGFWTEGAQRMVIDSAGDVGINTTNPTHKLHVTGDIKLQNSQIQLTNGYGLMWGTTGLYAYADTNYIRFDVGGSQAMRIISSGNVGIGTSDPEGALDVDGGIAQIRSVNDNALKITQNAANTYPANLSLTKSRGSYASPADVANDDIIGRISTTAYSGSQYWGTAYIDFEVHGTVSSNQRPPSKIVFYTNASNASTAAAMTIAASGDLSVVGNAVFNDAGAAKSFRVETDTLSNMLSIESGTLSGVGTFGIGVTDAFTNLNSWIGIKGPATTCPANESFNRMRINSGGGAVTIPAGTAGMVTTLTVDEPNITKVGTLVAAATLLVNGAPSEATTNYALKVDGGAGADYVVWASTANAGAQAVLTLQNTNSATNDSCRINFVNTSGTTVCATIEALRESANAATELNFYTMSTSGSATERMSIAHGGTVNVVGTFTAGTKTFQIPHPLPELNDTNYLIHGCLEGPRLDLIYRGTVTLVAGSATVDLDEAAGMTAGTWALLCRDAQVFSSNETGWYHVRGTVSGSTLTIECEEGICTDTVSWMVVAERQDDEIRAQSSTDDEGHLMIEPLQVEPPSTSASPSE